MRIRKSMRALGVVVVIGLVTAACGSGGNSKNGTGGRFGAMGTGGNATMDTRAAAGSSGTFGNGGALAVGGAAGNGGRTDGALVDIDSAVGTGGVTGGGPVDIDAAIGSADPGDGGGVGEVGVQVGVPGAPSTVDGGGEATARKYVVSASGLTVTDTSTGLIWQRNPDGRGMDCNGRLCTWWDARDYCIALDLNGPGWRLPKLVELSSLVDKTAMSEPTIDQAAFPNTPPDGFWTSTYSPGLEGMAYIIDFQDGNKYHAFLRNAYKVRCVR